MTATLNASNITTNNAATSLQSMPLYQAVNVMAIIMLPSILLFGTFGNVMIIIIMNRLRSSDCSSSVFVYFTALAVSDLVFIHTEVVRNLLILFLGIDYFAKWRAVCKLGFFSLYVSGVTSAWILVAMTVQRASSVLWPHRVNVLCTRKKAFFIVVGIVLFVACIHLHLFYGIDLVYDGDGKKTICFFQARLLYAVYAYILAMDRSADFFSFAFFAAGHKQWATGKKTNIFSS